VKLLAGWFPTSAGLLLFITFMGFIVDITNILGIGKLSPRTVVESGRCFRADPY
jgi:hypothetical protein